MAEFETNNPDPIEPEKPEPPKKEAEKLEAYVSTLKRRSLPSMGVWGMAIGITVALAAVVAAPTYLLKNKDAKFKEMTANYAKLQADYAVIKKKQEELEADRNNILVQTKRLIAEQSKLTELQDQASELTKANELIMRQKVQLHQESVKLKKELNTLESLFSRLKDSYQQLTIQKDALDKDNASLRKQLAQKIQSAPEYQKIEKEAKALQNENKKQADLIKGLNAKLKTALDRIGKIQGRDRQFTKQIQGYTKQAEKLKQENAKLVKTNQDLNTIVTSMPSNFKDIANQNKKLIRETAEMHYNMGVFFTENRKYDISVREFTRTLQIDPNHAKAHYNLGYLYAERYEKHPQAIGHFRRFLELNPTGKESELIRSYLLQREAMGDKPGEEITKGRGIA